MGSVQEDFAAGHDFTGPAIMHAFAGLLFDMDGTIIDSTNAIVKFWHMLGKELNVDPNVILQTSHGRRSIDVLKIVDPSKANWEFVCHAEGRVPREFGDDAVEIPGARALLDSLQVANARWGVVTSGTKPLVTGWLEVLKLPTPENLVTAESVDNGKPDPKCYLMGKEKIGVADAKGDVLVLEDAPAGIRAGKAAGCKVLGLATTHSVEHVLAAGADWVVKDLTSVRFVDGGKDGVRLEIKNTLVR